MKRRSLKRRFLWQYLALVAAPILALVLLALHSSYQAFEETAKSAAKTSAQQTRQLLEYYVNNVNEMINTLLGSEAFHKTLEKNNDQAQLREQIQDMLYLRRLLGACSGRGEVDDVYLFLDNAAIYIGENAQTRPLADARLEKWFDYVEDSFPQSVLIPGSSMKDPSQIGYAKAIRSTHNYNRTTGIILFLLNRTQLSRYLGEDGDSLAFVVNERGEQIVGKKNSPLSLPGDFVPAAADGDQLALGGARWYQFSTRLQGTDWYLVYLEPRVTLNGMLEARGWGYLLILVGILGLGVVFYFAFFRVYLKRIARMREHMSVPELPALMEPDGRGDEIDDLVHAYNDMLQHIEQLMKEQYRLGNQIREAELKTLYEQINPHFLYNTLAMINWLAEDGRTREVSQVITALSAFYRLCLNKGNENISLRDELRIAENFVYIQRMRFGTDIRMTVLLDAAYEGFMLPKLTLQPLVENALIHGILRRRDRCGEIRVQVSRRGDRLLIDVANDGLPMEEDVLRRLNAGTLRADGEHYGVWNVVQRVSLYYAAPCALTYSQEDGWIHATMMLPFAGKPGGEAE